MKRPESKPKNRRRLIGLFAIVSVCMCLLAVNLGYHMIYKGEERAQAALSQHTKDSIISAARGSILDRNGNDLAISATTNTIWIRPENIRENGKTDEEKAANRALEQDKLVSILGLSEETVEAAINSEKKLIKLAKNVNAETADILRKEELRGIEIVENDRRFYPLGSFASQILGSTTDDNEGLTGLELYYNKYLAGVNGRWITSKDSSSNSLVYGTNKYYDARDGYNIELTIDENIQYIVEQKIQEAKESTGAERVMCLMMDPKTGEILAMAQTDEYDPNDPRTPVSDEDKAAFLTMTDEEKVSYWNRLWRCFCVCDTYEPGSTFKLITTSIALDAGVTYPGETFYCNGKYQVAVWTLKCWYYPRSHGKETLTQAVENSCNPVMIQLVQRLGLTKYYAGLDSFAVTEKTGIDYPGEGSNILQNRKTAGPVGLATMSYGQGIAVTPISLVTAVSSLANDGKLMQPHLLKRVTDSEGKTVLENAPSVKSISVSSQTAKDMLNIMEAVVAEGGAGTAKISGYRIGGKTGTANKPEDGGYSENNVYASFIGVAPLDDPKFTILLIVDSPKGVLYGSHTAAPYAKDVMESVLLYMDVQPKYTEKELESIDSKKVEVPDLSGYSAEDAIGVLAGRGLKFSITPEVGVYSNLIVTDQYPKAGTTLPKDSVVTIYYEQGETELQEQTEENIIQGEDD